MASSASAPAMAAFQWRAGPVTRSRYRRTAMVYCAFWLAGLALWLAGPSAGWQAFGLGLWAPGMGFVATGGWTLLAIPLVLLLFLAAVFAWFAAGALLFPLLVWIGAAVAAALAATGPNWRFAPVAAGLILLAIAAALARRSARNAAAGSLQRQAREASTATLIAAAQAHQTAGTTADRDRELDPGQLASARYLLDRALQPLTGFAGFNQIDIFQTASLRYQINFTGYALGLVQRCYVPNFRGYVQDAQINLIEKAKLTRVWNYWVYETLWGRFNTDFDPANHENIMLTGYLGAQLGVYTKVTGDRRYEQPGSMTFRLTDRLTYRHDIHTIIRSLVDNQAKSRFCLFPCEPNWIYTVCNFRGMTALAAYDSLYGTSHIAQARDRWMDRLGQEFLDPAGKIIALRSSLTGLRFPFPSGELEYVMTANCFAPELAERLWAIGRNDLLALLGEHEGMPVFHFPDMGVDYGNYRRGNRAMVMGGVLMAAREMGDPQIAEAALNTLDLFAGRQDAQGVVAYGRGSNFANILAAQGRIMGRGDERLTFSGPAPAAAGGAQPVLQQATYPDVLVARAFSSGEDLDLVLRPGRGEVRTELVIAGLKPGRRYRADAAGQSFAADDQGKAALSIVLADRLALHIVPE